jgi:mRNA interferase MazF
MVVLPAEEVAVLDEYVRVSGLPSRSAGLRHAIRLLRLDVAPTRGSKAHKVRPAVIVSNDRANATATRLGRGS